jgi:hypothetical protein
MFVHGHQLFLSIHARVIGIAYVKKDFFPRRPGADQIKY